MHVHKIIPRGQTADDFSRSPHGPLTRNASQGRTNNHYPYDFPPDSMTSIGYRKFCPTLPSARITPYALLSVHGFLQLAKNFSIAFLPEFF